MKQHESGFIFVTSLMLIALVSLLILNLMQHSLLYFKALRSLEQGHKRFYQLASALQYIGNQAIPVHCNVKGDANEALLRLSQHQGCKLNMADVHFEYLVEDLGEFPCLVALKGDKKYSTHHRRLSMRLVSENLPDAFLQIRDIRPIEAKNCEQKEHQVHLGLSSWRYFPEVSCESLPDALR